MDLLADLLHNDQVCLAVWQQQGVKYIAESISQVLVTVEAARLE